MLDAKYAARQLADRGVTRNFQATELARLLLQVVLCNDRPLGVLGQKGDNEMTLMKRGRDPLAGFGNLQERIDDIHPAAV